MRTPNFSHGKPLIESRTPALRAALHVNLRNVNAALANLNDHVEHIKKLDERDQESRNGMNEARDAARKAQL